jgi:hypothetical protein
VNCLGRKSSRSEPVLKTVLGIDAKLLGAALMLLGVLLYIITANIAGIIGFLKRVGM